MDSRKEECIIIRKNREYLQRKEWITGKPLWTQYVYNAWRTRSGKKAAEVARLTGGVMVRFNPISGKKKVLGA